MLAPVSTGAHGMDIELLRTFIEVYRCRHFGKAADRLYVTQSAVSARIRQLETSLGCQLLTRERKQVHPTAEGERFLAHAESLLKQWERARREMAESARGGALLRVGAPAELWEARALHWFERHFRAHPGTAGRMRFESRESEQLMSRLVEGVLDLVLQFERPRVADVEHRLLAEMPLVLASTKTGSRFPEALKDDYIETDWGSTFAAAQSEFMDGRTPKLRMDSMHLALGWLRGNAGAAYLPEEIVVREPNLHVVEDAPRFGREVHACWSRRSDQRERVEALLDVTAAEK